MSPFPAGNVCQITPAYPPAISGVGDHAALLAGGVGRAGGQLRTVVAAGAAEGAVTLRRRSAVELAAALEPSGTALLHFSGYGYARWGLCWWLVEGIRAWKRRAAGRRLVTLFHEVYATGPIWRASFWSAGPQRRIARDLARLSDMAFVTSQGGYDQLKPLHPALRLEILPVYSNVGEPAEVAPLAERAPLAVVFGGAGRRMRAYAAAAGEAQALAAGFDRLGIGEVIDIGPGAVAPPALAGRPVRALGALSAAEVSAWLGRARLGLIEYPGHVLTKSGIAAAYFAHGVVVVNMSREGRLPDDLAEGREFVTPGRLSAGAPEPQVVADAGRAWYRPHGLDETLRRLTLAPT